MSLISGWLPIALQVVALIALLTAIGWRSHRRCALWLPISLLVGVVLAAVGYWYVGYQGWGHDTPFEMWVWITVAGFAAAVSVLGWRGITWWRRVVSILAVPLSLLCAAQALNISIGYLPTVQTAWQRLTDTQPPQWIRQDTLAKLQHDGVRPTRGTLVWVQTPDDVSGFSHRPELVYLPPVWFRSNPPPRLPVVMVIGAEFQHPADWTQAGNGLSVLDDFAELHHGSSPAVVFPDSSGSFSNDTECVDGPRGNASTHLTKEVIPYVISTFGVSSAAANWGLMAGRRAAPVP
jgi:S-formylglutathione hydrolase FrmB